MPAFRPAAVVNLKLRFDEALTLVAPDPPKTVQQRADAPPPRGAGERGGAASAPLILRRGSGEESFVMQRIPLQMTYEKPGYRQAGRFDVTLQYRDLPIDPRTVRAAAVEIHTGAISDDDFRDGMRGRNAQGARSSVLQTRDGDGGVNAETLRMVGVIDEWDVTHSGEQSRVHLTGRDLRAILLDTPLGIVPGAAQVLLDELDLSAPIDEVVAAVLSFNPLFDDFSVITNAADWPGGVVPSVSPADATPRHRKGARGQRSASASLPSATAGDSLSFWDLVVRYCFLVGGIPFFRGLDLVIRPASTVYDKLRGPVDPIQNPTPFLGGALRAFDAQSRTSITPALRARRLVYGRDIRDLRFSRKLAGWRRPKIVRAVALDDSGEYLVGIWPPEADDRAQTTRTAPAGKASLSEAITVPVPQAASVEQLTQIARSTYEETGRGELTGSVATNALASFGGDNADPDLLRLEPGDGVELLVDTRGVRSGAPLASTATDDSRRSFEDQVAEIAERLGDENLARVIVGTARGQVAELQRFFRVSNIKFSWVDGKCTIAFDFQNYVVARAQAGSVSTDPGAAERERAGMAGTEASGEGLDSL